MMSSQCHIQMSCTPWQMTILWRNHLVCLLNAFVSTLQSYRAVFPRDLLKKRLKFDTQVSAQYLQILINDMEVKRGRSTPRRVMDDVSSYQIMVFQQNQKLCSSCPFASGQACGSLNNFMLCLRISASSFIFEF